MSIKMISMKFITLEPLKKSSDFKSSEVNTPGRSSKNIINCRSSLTTSLSLARTWVSWKNNRWGLRINLRKLRKLRVKGCCIKKAMEISIRTLRRCKGISNLWLGTIKCLRTNRMYSKLRIFQTLSRLTLTTLRKIFIRFAELNRNQWAI